MSQASTEFSHLVHLIHTLALQEVQTIEVLIIVREEQLLVRSLYADNSLEDRALALLNPLAHRVKVGSEVASCREDTLLVFTLALTIELLPPLSEVVKFRLEVANDLNLLASLCIERLTSSSIDSSRVLIESNVLTTSLFHVSSTSNELFYVETSNSDRQQTYWSKNRETTTYIVRDDETLITLFVCASTGSTLLGIGNGYDHILSLFLATLILALLLQKTESESCLSCGTRLRDIDNTELLVLQERSQLVEVILTDVVTCEKDSWILLIIYEPSERIAETFDNGASTKVATTDTCNNNNLTLFTQCVGNCLNLIQELRSDRRWQMQPSQEIVTFTSAVLKSFLSGLYLRLVSLYCTFCEE